MIDLELTALALEGIATGMAAALWMGALQDVPETGLRASCGAAITNICSAGLSYALALD